MTPPFAASPSFLRKSNPPFAPPPAREPYPGIGARSPFLREYLLCRFCPIRRFLWPSRPPAERSYPMTSGCRYYLFLLPIRLFPTPHRVFFIFYCPSSTHVAKYFTLLSLRSFSIHVSSYRRPQSSHSPSLVLSSFAPLRGETGLPFPPFLFHLFEATPALPPQ